MAAIPSSLRRMNQRTLVRLLLRLEEASRADLAKAAGMSQPTVGKIAEELLKSGVLEEVEKGGGSGAANGSAVPRPGRPGRMLRLDRTTPRFVAIQLGIAETRLAMLPVAVPTEDQWAVTIPTPDSPEKWVKALKRAAARLPHRQAWGVVLSVPGVVDEAAGWVLLAPNLHWIERTSLPALLKRVWDAPAALVQEIRALALGHLAVENGSQDFLLVDFGHGMGASAVIGGRLFMGGLPLSGELGHTPVLGNHRTCGCGGTGCIETLIARRGLLESFAEQRGGSRSWSALVEHIRRRGVQPWLARSLDAAAVVIAGATNVLGLRRVVITGDLTQLPPAVVQHLSDAVTRSALWARFGEVHCQAAPRHWVAGLAATAIDRLLVPEAQVLAADEPLYTRNNRSRPGVPALSPDAGLASSSSSSMFHKERLSWQR